MSEQFLFFCTNIGNEKLLKAEVQNFYPDFKLSYSRKGFITFKNQGIQYDLNTIHQLELTFATRAGICLGKTNPENLKEELQKQNLELEKYEVHSFSINTDFEIDAEEALQVEVNKYTPINKSVINLITLGVNEVWIGIHRTGKMTTSYPNARVDCETPEASPSKAYAKIAEAVKLFNIKINRNDGWLDFGSAPGGASYFLLEEGARVWGIDTAKVDSSILKNSNYKHIKKPMQDLSQEELPGRGVEWIHVDLNLNPKQAIKEILRLAKKYGKGLRGILFTVQVVKADYVQEIENFEDAFFDWGFNEVYSRQVPSHKNEYVIIARNK